MEAAIAAQKAVLETTRHDAAAAQKCHAAAVHKRKRALNSANERAKRSKKKKLAAELAQVAEETARLAERQRELQQEMSRLDGVAGANLCSSETAQ